MRGPKSAILLASIVVAGVVFLAWTQPWLSVSLTDGSVLAIDGSVAAPAASILALTTLVLVGALAIAGPFFRLVLGALEAVLGFTIAFSSSIALVNPVVAASPTISKATGVAGHTSIAALVTATSGTAWPVVAVIAGALILGLGVAAIATSRRWPASGRKYSAVRLEPQQSATAADSWDALSAGEDPTNVPERSASDTAP